MSIQSGRGIAEPKLHVVQAGVLFPTLHFARELGLDMQRLQHRSLLPEDVLEDPGHFVPAASWPQLFDEISKETGLRDVGWRTSLADPLKFYPNEFNEFSNAPTLLEGLRHICRANQSFSNNQHIWLRFTRDYAYACHFDEDRGPGYAQRTAFRTGIGMSVIRSFLAPGWCPRLILTETPLDAMPSRESLAGARIRRWRGYGAIQIPRFLLSVPSRRARTGGYRSEDSPAPSLPEQIRQMLRSYVGESLPDAKTTAEMLHISERTLQRRLEAFSTTYRALVHSARFDIASELLKDSSRRIIDVAAYLGFDDQSHFTRFFRRFSGVTPGEYRRLSAMKLYEIH